MHGSTSHLYIVTLTSGNVSSLRGQDKGAGINASILVAPLNMAYQLDTSSFQNDPKDLYHFEGVGHIEK